MSKHITSYSLRVELTTGVEGFAFNNLISTHSEYNTPFDEWINEIRDKVDDELGIWFENVAYGKAVLEDGGLVGYITGFHPYYYSEEMVKSVELAALKIQTVFAEYLTTFLKDDFEISPIVSEEFTQDTKLPAYQLNSFWCKNSEDLGYGG